MAQIGVDGWQDYDIIVVSKRLEPDLRREISKPLVLDVLDFWQQPFDDVFNDSAEGALELLQEHLEALRPDAVIPSTGRMAQDMEASGLNRVFRVTDAIPHHGHPAVRPLKFDPAVPDRLVYVGDPAYVGDWTKVVPLTVNPAELRPTDQMIALRFKPYRSYMSRHWKPGAKAAHAIACGLPFLWMPESGCAEVLQGKGLPPFTSLRHLKRQLDELQSPERRLSLYRASEALRPQTSVAEAADRMDRILRTIWNEA